MLGRLSRKEFLTLGAGVSAGLLLAGCGGGPENNPAVQGGTGGGGKKYTGPNVELDYWNGLTGGDGPVMRDMVQQFNAEHDNIKVKMNTIEWAAYYQKVPTAVQSGKGPDVGLMHVDTLPTNAARQVVAPLDDLAKTLGWKPGDFVPAVWEAGLYNGQRYGIPLDVHPQACFYNKGALEKAGLDPDNPPQTGEDYMSALEELKAAGIQGHWQYPSAGFTFQTLIWQLGGDLYNEDAAKATFNSDAGVEALTWMVDLVKKGYSPKNVGPGADFIAFQNGKNAFFWSGPWNINPFKEVKRLEFGVVPLPQIGSEKAAWAGSHQFVMMRQRTPDENSAEASKVFINWISRHSMQWAAAGQVPARASVRQDPEFKQELEEQYQFARQIPYLHFSPSVPGINEIFPNTVDPAANQAILLKKEPKPALDEAAAKANKILAENREKYQTS
jgi:multiple sugar transport system substrate-binding protein